LLALILEVCCITQVVVNVDGDDLTAFGTRFVFTPPTDNLALMKAIAHCQAVVVDFDDDDDDDSSSSSSSYSSGFSREYFGANGFRPCTLFEYAAITSFTKLPAGNYVSYASGEGFDVTVLRVDGEGHLTDSNQQLFGDGNDHYGSNRDGDLFDVVCCSAAQYLHEHGVESGGRGPSP
jgi:hypothetical protein